MSTTTYTQTKIHVTEHPPFVCSSCGCQHIDSRHVDFGAAWDGPVLEVPESTNKHAVDDLIICERCLRESYVALAFDDRPVHDDVAALEQELAETRKELAREKRQNEGIQRLVDAGWFKQHKPGRKPEPKTEKETA
jgi:hypothetical protein